MTIQETNLLYRIAIGDFLIAFAHLEPLLYSICGNHLLESDPKSNKLKLDNMSFSSQLALLKSYINKLDKGDKLRTILNDLTNELSDLNSFRNKIVHSPLIRKENEEGKMFLMLSGRRSSAEPELIELGSLKKQLENANNLLWKLFDLSGMFNTTVNLEAKNKTE